ncbi:MAG TPA: DUF4129 domain-containing protein, partial [Pyrinomonadaceae bacterium]
SSLLKGDAGALAVVTSPLVGGPVALALAFGGAFYLRRRGLLKLWGRRAAARGNEAAVVEFYQRMTAALGSRGIARRADQTPLEFAEAVGTPEVRAVTSAYHRVRYGAQDLTRAEAEEVERHLRRMEEQRQ